MSLFEEEMFKADKDKSFYYSNNDKVHHHTDCFHRWRVMANLAFEKKDIISPLRFFYRFIIKEPEWGHILVILLSVWELLRELLLSCLKVTIINGCFVVC